MADTSMGTCVFTSWGIMLYFVGRGSISWDLPVRLLIRLLSLISCTISDMRHHIGPCFHLAVSSQPAMMVLKQKPRHLLTQ